MKQYFEEARTFNWPQGHPTVAFTEAQLYHHFMVLTNETVSMSYNTMDYMVILAVKGTPATSKSRTEQLETFKRARTPFPTHNGGTSSEGTTTPTNYDSYTEGDTSAEDETGDSTFHEKLDSAMEMALIEQNFVRPTTSQPVDRFRPLEVSFFNREVPYTSDTSCPDETLSRVRNHVIAEKTIFNSKGKQAQKRRRVTKRGVPMS